MKNTIKASEGIPSLNVPFVMYHGNDTFIAIRRALDGKYICREVNDVVNTPDDVTIPAWTFEKDFKNFTWHYLSI